MADADAIDAARSAIQSLAAATPYPMAQERARWTANIALNALMPDGRPVAAWLAEVDRLRAENVGLRGLIVRFYTQAWETPLTSDEDELIARIVLEADRG